MAEKIKHVMDFSNYKRSHRLYSSRRKYKVGYLKNEIPKDNIISFVGVRSKTYAFKTEKREKKAKCKGVKKHAKDQIPFNSYVRCINKISSYSIKQQGIISKKHVNKLITCEKIAFSSFDDKRYLLCKIHSVPYGSFLIRKFEKTRKCFFCANPTIFV